MDLGAMICTPRSPNCAVCPVAGHCRARGDAARDYPRKAAPAAKKAQDLTILLMLMDGKLLVRRRPKGLLGGLYEFPALEGRFDGEAALADALAARGFGGVRLVRPLPGARHVFTHLVWRMVGWLAVCDAAPEGYIAVDRPQLSALPFPSALRAYREIAEDATGQDGVSKEALIQ